MKSPAQWRRDRAASSRHRQLAAQEEQRKIEYAARNVPSARPAQVAFALEELRRRVDGIGRRSESLSARAGVLVSSAALVATLQTGREENAAILGAVAMALVAAAFGVYAIFPGRSPYPSIQSTREEIWLRADIADSQWWLVDRLSEQYELAAQQIENRGLLLQGGFVSLGLSILLTAVGIAT